MQRRHLGQVVDASGIFRFQREEPGLSFVGGSVEASRLAASTCVMSAEEFRAFYRQHVPSV